MSISQLPVIAIQSAAHTPATMPSPPRWAVPPNHKQQQTLLAYQGFSSQQQNVVNTPNTYLCQSVCSASLAIRAVVPGISSRGSLIVSCPGAVPPHPTPSSPAVAVLALRVLSHPASARPFQCSKGEPCAAVTLSPLVCVYP